MSKIRFDFAGRRAVVTGGARGIGEAIARRLLDSGARVALWDRDQAALLATRDRLASLGEVHAYPLDVSSAEQVRAAADAAHQVFGDIDVLVNNAGITGPHVPLWELTPEDWRRVLEVDLTGPFLACRAFAPRMREAGYGRIVNLASVAGKEGTPLLGAYSSAKAGLIAMTKSLGKELAGTGVLVNCVTPGPVRTEMVENAPPAQVATMLSKCPMGRLIEPDEVATTVAWLASEGCTFVTGSVHDLSGGRSTY